MVILIALERLFLSDLCGREVLSGNGEVIVLFLSDLCGREDIIITVCVDDKVSKRPVRS